MLIRMKKAQSTLEYALLITVVIGALLTMQNYLKRGMQGSLRDKSDQISEAHYSPGLTNNTATMTTTSDVHEAISSQWTTTTTGSQNTSENRDIEDLADETWPAHWE
ncbi:MAG: hypothetical protein GF375_02035 [Candidatus Omnitrophica bacterium]|nr:hypothetical protein [Candidatus Omnitrophota bacterium]